MKRKEIAQIVAMLSAAYPNSNITESTSQVYERMLADLDVELTERAIARLIGTSKFLPTIAEIRAAVTDLERGAVRAGADAWLDVVSEIRRVGIYRAPAFGDPIVAQIVKRWGWRALCDGTNEAADRARFCELYDSLAHRQRSDVASGIPLPAPECVRALPSPESASHVSALVAGLFR